MNNVVYAEPMPEPILAQADREKRRCLCMISRFSEIQLLPHAVRRYSVHALWVERATGNATGSSALGEQEKNPMFTRLSGFRPKPTCVGILGTHGENGRRKRTRSEEGDRLQFVNNGG